MKRLIPVILILCLILNNILFGYGPSSSTLDSYSVSIGSGTWDTTIITNVMPSGDSTGIMIDINQDSISGYVLYDYVTPNGNSSSSTISEYDTAITLNANLKGGFSYALKRKAGSYKLYVYVLLNNIKSVTQTVTVTLYQIKWQ